MNGPLAAQPLMLETERNIHQADCFVTADIMDEELKSLAIVI